MEGKANRIKVGDLVADMRGGVYDVLEFQRIFNRDPRWVVALIDSLLGNPYISTGALLLWQPATGSRPVGGRYQASTDATIFILDGQQRMTAIMAALGLRPPWIPDDRWKTVRGPDLAVSVGLTRSGKAEFRPARLDVAGEIPLGELYDPPEGGIKVLADNAGLGVEAIEPLTEMAHRLRDADVLVDWMPGDTEAAFKGFVRRNQRATVMALKDEELKLAMLAKRYPPLMRDHLDPLRHDATRAGFERCFGLKRLNQIIQRMLPPTQRGGNGLKAEPGRVEQAANRTVAACRDVIAYLKRCGITSELLLSQPAAVEVLAALFAGHPAAKQHDFAKKWLAHVIAGQVFFGKGPLVRQTARAVDEAGTYDSACAALAAVIPAGPPSPFPIERLLSVGGRGHFSMAATLYAMACAEGLDGPVADLFDSGLRHPVNELQLMPLCPEPTPGMVIHYAFMDPKAAAIIGAHGGWTQSAYEELACGDATLRAHQLPAPRARIKPGELGAWLVEERGKPMSYLIDRFLAQLGPLRTEPEDAGTSHE